MSHFSKSHYVWLSSFFRDELYASRNANELLIKATQKTIIENLANAFEKESPGFNKQLFLDNIYKDPTKHN